MKIYDCIFAARREYGIIRMRGSGQTPNRFASGERTDESKNGGKNRADKPGGEKDTGVGYK